MTAPDRAAFVRTHVAVARPPLVPEIALHQATEVTSVSGGWRRSLAT